jgi:site-specific DNA-methyltransferase (cytosine-N4-specific)
MSKQSDLQLAYRTNLGRSYIGSSEEVLANTELANLQGRVNLIFTSPPFPLTRKKAYGNLKGKDYIKWLSDFGPIFRKLLAKDGSLVIELGNVWDQGLPTMSLTPIKSLIRLKERGKFYLCQEFVWHNTGKLPSPAQWVNVKRIRVKDSFTRFWWLSPTPNPKADNRAILKEYSDSMKKLLSEGKYNSGLRPSEHRIGEKSFCRNNNGAIPPNVFSIANTASTDPYLEYCRKAGITNHPCRMPIDLAKFFIHFLTKENDIVLDPFAGSNVTGYVAEINNRQWVSIELSKEYACSAMARFDANSLKDITIQ